MQITVSRNETKHWIDKLETSAEVSMLSIANLAADNDAMSFLYECKFHENGFDPLDYSKPLNFVEQLNQTFTYLASFKGAEFIFSKHVDVKSLTLNLGTSKGSDIETVDGGGVVAEVFASVDPTNNSKLQKDIKRISSKNSKYKYVFFISPKTDSSVYKSRWDVEGVTVISFGDGSSKEKI
jgi:hypothetical protein